MYQEIQKKAAIIRDQNNKDLSNLKRWFNDIEKLKPCKCEICGISFSMIEFLLKADEGSPSNRCKDCLKIDDMLKELDEKLKDSEWIHGIN